MLRRQRQMCIRDSYNTCQNYVLQYVNMSVDKKDGTSFGNVGTFITMFEWVSDAEAERLKEQGY